MKPMMLVPFAVGFLALVGCNRSVTPEPVVITGFSTVAEHPGAAMFEAAAERGGVGELYGRYRVACTIDGSLGDRTTHIDFRLLLAPMKPDNPIPESITIRVTLASDTLGKHEFKIETAKGSPQGNNKVAKVEDTLILEFPNIYDTRMDWANKVTHNPLPLGTHTITVRIAIDDKEEVTLPHKFPFRVVTAIGHGGEPIP